MNMKPIISSYEGHPGRPGQRGGSAPRNTGEKGEWDKSMKQGDLVKYSNPQNEEEAKMRFRIKEIHHDGNPPRAHIIPADWNPKHGKIIPIETLHPSHLIKAKAQSISDAIECRAAVEIPPIAGNEILFLPIGLHAITPVAGGIGRPIKVKITAEAAQAIEAQRTQLMAKGKRPYFDFNHEDGPASFWPESFAWRSGEGVIARGEWSRRGKTAIEGKDFRAFSPVFHVDNKRAEAALVVCNESASPNMGGLVNNPAFNLPLWAKNAGVTAPTTTNNGDNEMTTEELAALRAKQQELEAEVSALKAANDDSKESKETELKNIELQIEANELRNESERLKGEIRAKNKTFADGEIADAIKAGRILPKDYQQQEFWRSQIIANPDVAKNLRHQPGHAEHLTQSVIASYGRVTVTEDAPNVVFGALAKTHQRAICARSLEERKELSREFAAIYARELAIKSSNRERTESFTMWEMDRAIEAGDVTDVNLGTLSGTLVVQRSLELLKFTFPDVTSFTTDFSDQTAAFNQTIMTRYIDIPTAVDYNTTTGWAASTHVTHDVPVTINKHKGVQIVFNEQTLASTVRRLFDESAAAATYSLGKTFVDELYSKITDANFTHNRVVATASFTRSSVVDINADLDLLGVPYGPNMRTLLLYPTVFAQLQKDTTVTALGYTQRAALITDTPLNNRSNYISDIGGFNVVSCPNLPTNNANLTGFAGSKSALCIATRMPNDYTTWGTGVSHGNVQMITEPDIGMSVMLVQYVDHTLGTGNQRFSWMFGCAAGQGNAGELLKAATGSGSSRTS